MSAKKTSLNLSDHKQYTYRVIWSEDDHEFVGLCAEFPSLSWLEKNQEEALRGIVALVGQTIADMKLLEEPIPEPLSLHKYSGRFMVRTTPELHRWLTVQSVEAGVSLNRFVNSRLREG
ncbi:MAG: type II toxin-antitoxin system HicB family antitoxin [Candidatus Adiutrix sp.]|jgi:predicted RNase H-like HicB family nuclease|nr:type II toxin-antitoxin system HicB family antitoxin [Candidatus Adiutrix sp.]